MRSPPKSYGFNLHNDYQDSITTSGIGPGPQSKRQKRWAGTYILTIPSGTSVTSLTNSPTTILYYISNQSCPFDNSKYKQWVLIGYNLFGIKSYSYLE